MILNPYVVTVYNEASPRDSISRAFADMNGVMGWLDNGSTLEKSYYDDNVWVGRNGVSNDDRVVVVKVL